MYDWAIYSVVLLILGIVTYRAARKKPPEDLIELKPRLRRKPSHINGEKRQ